MVLLALCSTSFAQQKFTDAQLFQMLLDQNGQIKAEVLEAQRQQSLSDGAAGWQALSASFMVGQFNSAYNKDNNLTLSQAIPYNGALRLQKQLGGISSQLSEQDLALLKKDFKRALDEQLEYIRMLHAQLNLAKIQDSLYGVLDEKMKLRVSLGDAAKMDQVLVHSKYMRANAMLAQQNQVLQNAWLALHTLLSYNGPAFELAQPQAIDFLKLPVYEAGVVHPSLLRYDIQKQQLELQNELNRAQQLPQLGLGYFNQSLVGIQNIDGSDQYFGPNKRFQGAMLQTQIPIDFRAYKARSSSLELALIQNELLKNQQALALSTQKNQIFGQLSQRIETYQMVATPIESELTKLQADAELQLTSGQISLIEFIQLQDYQIALQGELLEWQHQIKLLHISYEWIQK
jgi:cobalt-zinc-cadmium resistance protein CzcA